MDATASNGVMDTQQPSSVDEATQKIVEDIIYSFDKAGVSETDGQHFCLVLIKSRIYATLA
jgi:hypothetical protein